MKGVPDLVLVAYDIVKSLFIDTWEVLVLVLFLTTLAQFIFGCWARRLLSLWRGLWKRKCPRCPKLDCVTAENKGAGIREDPCQSACCPRAKSKSRTRKRAARKRRKYCDSSSSSTTPSSSSSPSCSSSSSCCPESCCGSYCSYRP